ncbi:MAG: helix-turn-helix domain-containing protein [Saprospiraceae bacterium]|nr:helix-turn-helix domain-containing protein [Saprospiraceae bacterium]
MTETKITNPFEVLDERLAKIECLLTQISNQSLPQVVPAQMQHQDYLTRREVAEFLDICLTTVDHLSNAGILRKYRSGRVVRFLRTEVVQAISGSKKGPFFHQTISQKP